MSKIQEMKEHLNGMYFEGEFTFQIPTANSSRDAICIFKKNIANITYNFMTSLEQNPTNLPQTETILKGQSVSGISIDDLMQVKHYGDGVKVLLAMLKDESFLLNEATASKLHEYVGKEEAFTWGKFRNTPVSIGNVDYIPPDSHLLKDIAQKGFDFLEKQIESPSERAIAVFLFMARNQFFHDANKRTASLMMNGHLLQNGIYPITIFDKESEEFHTKLSEFYNTGNATKMMQFFEQMVQKMYPGATSAGAFS